MPPQPGSPNRDHDATETSPDQSMQGSVPSAPTGTRSAEVSPDGRARPRANSSSGSGSIASVPGRKRRTPSSITPNACTNCKKARTKCDGGRPACKRCTDRHVENQCQYAVHVKTAKDQMMREIHRLQQQTETLVNDLASLGEANKWAEQIMQSLKENGHGPEVVARLKRGESHEAIARWLQHLKLGVFQTQSPTIERRFNRAIEQIHRNFAENPSPLYWTNVARTPALIEHLMKLYFTWIHPVHMLFDQAHFEHSFQTYSDDHCSAPLVNVICAMACHLLHKSHGSDAAARKSISDLRDQFMVETKYYLQQDLENTKMTTIQTHAILFLVDLSSGHGQRAASYLRLAVENLMLITSEPDMSEAEEVAFWGILTLHTVWSGLTYQKPSAPVSPDVRPFEKLVRQQDLDNHWHSYTTEDDDKEGHDQDDTPSHALATASEYAKLFRIVHKNILVYCGSRGKVTAPKLLEIYQRYEAWKGELPHDIADLSGEPLPHSLFLHIQYHTALIHFLQPLLHLQGNSEADYENLRQQVLNHARAGLRLLRQYQIAYSQYFLTPLQIFSMIHICEAFTRYGGDTMQDPDCPEIVDFCLRALEQNLVSYPIAGPLQQMFRSSLTDQGLSLPAELTRQVRAAMQYSPMSCWTPVRDQRIDCRCRKL